MQVYETTFIVNPQLDDKAIDQKVNAVSDLIKNHGGKIVHTDHMGTRRLAYEIKGLNQGYYGSFIYETQSEFPATLERYFKLDELYLRHLTVRYEGDLEKLKEPKSEESFGASVSHHQKNAPSKPAPAVPRPVSTEAKPTEVKEESVETAKTAETSETPETDESKSDDSEKTDEIILDSPETKSEEKTESSDDKEL